MKRYGRSLIYLSYTVLNLSLALFLETFVYTGAGLYSLSVGIIVYTLLFGSRYILELFVTARRAYFASCRILSLRVRHVPVEKPNGSFLLTISHFLFPAETHKRLVVQAVADMWEQQHVALSNGEVWRYRWIGIRDQGRIIMALAMEPFSKLLAKLISPFLTK